jgi:REP element-mobilizing transposase RayT
MPRHPRLDTPGSFHHVMNRGARRQRVFGDDESHLRFLGLLAQLPGRFGVGVHGFSLMPNHFHLLIETGPHGLGPAMQFLQAQYSRWLNQVRRWDGPIWRGRFTSRRIEDEPYLGHVLAYIHRNPVEARICTHEDQARWTSHLHYVGESAAPEWLSTTTLLDVFGGKDAYRDYLDAMRTGRQAPPEGFQPDDLWRQPSRVATPLTLVPSPPTERPSVWSLEAAWRALEAASGKTQDKLCHRKMGSGPQGWWWLTLWWLRTATRLPGADLSVALGVHRSALSRAERRLRAAAARQPRLAAARAALEGQMSRNGGDPEHG